jgi:pyruvate-ferredoxin/flavodoxin oxidoreductase
MNKENFKYPGISTTADGSQAVVWVEQNITQGGLGYPITPTTNMGAFYQLAVANGYLNLWGEPLIFIEPESEHSSASGCEGFALAGGRVTNFTSGQGLILMKEVLYTISGKRLPVVFHIGARALTSQSLNIHAGHDDVMGVSDCGWGMLFGKNAQDAADLALIARRAAEDSFTPFMNIQDGFLTTHTIESVLLPEKEFMKEYIGEPDKKLLNLFNPHEPVMTGVVQNQDSYMKGKIAQRDYYEKVPAALRNAMDEFYILTGRKYDFVERHQMDDAEYAIVGMGTAVETAMATVDWMRKNQGIKAGVIGVTSFRPFPKKEIVDALSNLKAFTVIERMDNPLACDNPLTAEIKSSFTDAMLEKRIERIPEIYSCVYGLGSRDVRPGHFIAIVKNMMSDKVPSSGGVSASGGRGGLKFFSVGIEHSTSLEANFDPDIRDKGTFSMRGHSIGGYGSVTTNKVIASLMASIFGYYVQAYPKYGSEKKGLPTTYYLTISKNKVRTHCELEHVEFIPLNDIYAFFGGNPLAGLSNNGTVFIQSDEEDPSEVWRAIPDYAKKIILEKNIKLYYMDTAKIGREISSNLDLQIRMQGIVLLGIFLKVSPFKEEAGLSDDDLFKNVEEALRKYFGHRGEKVVAENLQAVKRGFHEVKLVPENVKAMEGIRIKEAATVN